MVPGRGKAAMRQQAQRQRAGEQTRAMSERHRRPRPGFESHDNRPTRMRVDTTHPDGWRRIASAASHVSNFGFNKHRLPEMEFQRLSLSTTLLQSTSEINSD